MKKSEIAVNASLVPVDYLMVVLAGIVSYFVRYVGLVQEIRPVVFDLNFSAYMDLLWGISLIWVFGFALAGLYSMKGTKKTIDELSRIVLGCSTAVMILMFVFFFSRSLFDSRFIIIAGWIFSIIFVIIGRGMIRMIQKYFYSFDVGVHRVAIIGMGNLAEEVVLSFKNNKKAGFKIVKKFEDFSRNTEIELEKLAKADKIDEILAANPNLSPSQLSRLNDFSYLNHIDLKYVADIFDFPMANFEITTIAGLPIIEVKKTRLDGWGRICKRIFDVVVSLILIILLSPIFLLIALAVKIDSRGTVFFVYKRIGQYGKPFTYFKFRSMIKNVHKFRFDPKFLKKHQNLRKGSPMMKFKNDPRVTRVGKFLRKFSLDELPELFNVFVGKMSLVGPRPHEVEEVEKYETFHKKVLTIKPGMTGMAQVSGRSDLDFDDEVRLDVWYMENWGLKLDISILFKTPLAVLKKRKAE